MPTERVTFDGSAGPLAAKLHSPPGNERATAIFAHCFTCSKDIRAAVRIAEALEARGITVLRFDFTGLGQSKGEFADTNFSSNVEDVIAAAEFLSREHRAPTLLIGHSLGGAAVLKAAAKLDGIKAVATIGAPADAAHVAKLFRGAHSEIEETGEADVEIGGRPFRIKKQLLDDLKVQSVSECVAELNAALLICHAPLDNIVGIGNASAIFTAAKHPKSFLSLDSADHLLSKAADANYAADCIAAWSSRYLDVEQVPYEERVVVTTGASGFATDVRSGPHRLRVDEPRALGGTETGPSPYAYLLAALGSCTSITLRMYADRKKLALEQVSVSLKHEKTHAKDCEDCETTGGKVDIIEREIELTGDLTDAERSRLLEIADKCPVHKTLHSEIKVRTKLV